MHGCLSLRSRSRRSLSGRGARGWPWSRSTSARSLGQNESTALSRTCRPLAMSIPTYFVALLSVTRFRRSFRCSDATPCVPFGSLYPEGIPGPLMVLAVGRDLDRQPGSTEQGCENHDYVSEGSTARSVPRGVHVAAGNRSRVTTWNSTSDRLSVDEEARVIGRAKPDSLELTRIAKPPSAHISRVTARPAQHAGPVDGPGED